jgi:riboflavin kinase/FMN adenylyltransferase
VPVSSTRIRDRIRSGDVVEAEMLLGHPYWLLGTVVSGQRLGRTLGYPTANLQPAVQQAIPADGIYAVMAALDDGRTFSGACSIGDRPTVPGAGRSIEVFLLEFDEQIYDRTLSIRFLEKLRDEERFESLEALKEQMATDVAQTRAICDARTPDR